MQKLLSTEQKKVMIERRQVLSVVGRNRLDAYIAWDVRKAEHMLTKLYELVQTWPERYPEMECVFMAEASMFSVWHDYFMKKVQAEIEMMSQQEPKTQQASQTSWWRRVHRKRL